MRLHLIQQTTSDARVGRFEEAEPRHQLVVHLVVQPVVDGRNASNNPRMVFGQPARDRRVIEKRIVALIEASMFVSFERRYEDRVLPIERVREIDELPLATPGVDRNDSAR